MPGSKLDPIDRMILAELQADGRMTNVELAKRVGISAPPCLRRVRTLEEVGRQFNVTRERIRQIEAKALRKMRHPTRIRQLHGFFEPDHASRQLEISQKRA